MTRAGTTSAQAESAEDEPRRRPGSGTPESASDQIASGHVPVLVDAVVAALAPRDGAIYVDGTFGAGGYSAALLAAARCRVFGIDRDPDAVRRGAALAAAHPGRLQLVEGRFGDMERLVAAAIPGPVAGIALDLGVSSMQLDAAERGFSFRLDGPLDMRMGAEGESAADLVARLSEGELAGTDPLARRGALRRPRRARDRRGAPACADSPHRRACRDRPRRDPDSASPGSIRRPARFRRCASRSMTSSANSIAGWPPPSGC